MVTEQIEQELNARRAAIDGRLALLSSRAASARQTATPIGFAFLTAAAALFMWKVGRRVVREQRARMVRRRMLRYAS